MPRFPAAALAAAALLGVAAGHYCRDGSRVACTKVRPSGAAPSTFDQGYGARGYPTCTEEGQRVFCLYDHDYHQCGGDRQPCCRDGSNPSHGRSSHSHDGVGQDLQCTGAGATTAAAADANTTVLLDDMDRGSSSSTRNAFEGSYMPCMVDAYGGQYHHDWAQQKGSASFEFKFMPPADGCYALEEHHPGESWLCSRYLPRNARLDVDYSKGNSTTIYIDQSVSGGQWNEVGTLPFYEGHEGRLTMRNAPGEQCEVQSGCFWVVDAFRLTWKGAECPSRGGAAAAAATAATTEGGVVAAGGPDAADANEGSLLLGLSLGAEDAASVQMRIQDQSAVLEATLAIHLGYRRVTISQARLLAPGRRLLEQRTASMRMPFTALEKVAEPSGGSLRQALQADFDTISPGVAVSSVKVAWLSAEATADEEGPENLALYIAAASAGLVVVCLIGTLVWKLKRRSSTKLVNADPVEAAPAKETPWDPEKAKGVDDVEIASVSTGPPASDRDANDDGASSEGNSMSGSGQAGTD